MKEKQKTGNWFWDAVYPRRCPVCDGLLSQKEPYLCRNCVEKIHPIHGARCKKCGKPVEDEAEFCRDCSRTRHSFDRGFAPYSYHGELEASLMRFKYHERQEYAGFYAHAACRYVGSQIRRRNAEVLVPVPIHPARRRYRGYNQAEVFAKRLSEEFQIPMNAHLIRRVKRTKPQKELDPAERRKNLENAFALEKPGQMKYRRILLVDDIYTTGSTVDALAALLKKNGAVQVDFLCAAIVK
ncbi:ComF family protein [Fusicatenibacter sp.]